MQFYLYNIIQANIPFNANTTCHTTILPTFASLCLIGRGTELYSLKRVLSSSVPPMDMIQVGSLY